MARLLALSCLLVVLLAGCTGAGRQPVPLPDVSSDLPKGRDPPPPPAHDCAAQTLDAGDTRFVRIQCRQGTGTVTADLSGCAPTADASAWLTLETPRGRFGQGNATVRVDSGGAGLASLRVDAAQDEGKEARVALRDGYALTLSLDAWKGEQVTAAVQCPSA